MKIRSVLGSLAVVLVTLGSFGVANAGAATITVNGTTDVVADSGSCSLREAITAANNDSSSGITPGECAAGSGADVIAFNIAGPGPHSIVPASELPEIITPVTIDGSTEVDQVILDGVAASSSVALELSANSSTIKDLSIIRWGFGVWAKGDGSQILDNRIGTTEGDLAGLGNDAVGILVEEGDNMVIRGNVISGNGQQGIRAYDDAVENLTIQSNLIGTNSTGTAAIPNYDGVSINSPDGALVGGAPDEGNLISGNTAYGVLVAGGSFGTIDGAVVRNNRIGTNLAGTSALPNLQGLAIRGDARSVSVEDNLISGNGTGIQFEDVFTVANTPSGVSVTGNRIGVNATGDAILANDRNIEFVDVDNPFGPGIVIGGVTGQTPGDCTGDCNVIAGSTVLSGIFVGDGSDDVAILGNEIRDNDELGIDLSSLPPGVTLNDPGDADTGPNGLQNFPVIDAAFAVGGVVLVTGSLDSVPGESFRVEIFGNQTPDPSTFGEGESFLGGFTAETPAGDSTVPFAQALNTQFAAGSSLSSTATLLDPVNNRPVTSEFGPQSNEGCDETGSNSAEELVADGTGEVLCALGGDDNLKSGDAGDILLGGAGTDTADYGEFASGVAASLAINRATHGSIDILVEIENLAGTPQADFLTGAPGPNLIRGDDGADQINPGAGADTVLGGSQNDDIVVDDGVADTLVNCGPGNDTVTADPTLVEPAFLFIDCESIIRPLEPEPEPSCETDPSLCPPPTCETDPSLCPPEPVIYKCDGIKATIVGTNNSETINGTDKRDVIVARAGKDKINPKKGNDLVCAGDGVDTVSGSGGNDRILGQEGADTLKAGDGNDKLLGGPKDDKLYGHAHGDILKGGEGSDRLEGGANADTLYGEGHGKDKLYGNKGKDKLNGGDGGKDFCDGGSNKDRRKAPGCEKRRSLP